MKWQKFLKKKYIKKLAIVKVKKFLELDMMRTLVLICFFYNSLKIFPIYKIEFTIKFMIFQTRPKTTKK